MFSVAIPVYNHAPYLTTAVVSALRSPQVSEVLVVDDGSSDGSAELLGRLARSNSGRIRDLTRPGEGNRGAHARLNQLVEAAREDWIAVLNSDDAFLPGRFEAIRRLVQAGDATFVCGHLVCVDDADAVIGTKRGVLQPEFPFPGDFDSKAMLARGAFLQLLANQNFVATTSNMVFTKQLHREIGGFRDLRYVHDWDFALRASLHGRFAYLPQFLSLYRLHATNTIKTAFEEVAVEVRGFMEDFLAENPRLEQDPAFHSGLLANRYLEVTRGETAHGSPVPQTW